MMMCRKNALRYLSDSRRRHIGQSVEDEAYKAYSAYQVAPDIHTLVMYHKEALEEQALGVKAYSISCPYMLVVYLEWGDLVLRANERSFFLPRFLWPLSRRLYLIDFVSVFHLLLFCPVTCHLG